MKPRANIHARRRLRLIAGALALFASAHAVFAAYDILDCHAHGVVSTLNGAGVVGYRNGRFEKSFLDSPSGVSCNTTKCYVTDTGNDVIRVIDLAKSEIVNFAANDAGTAGFVDGKALACTSSGETQALFNAPRGVELVPSSSSYYPGHVLVADTGNGAIRLIADGDVTTITSSSVSAPLDLALDTSDGSVYVVSSGTNDVKKLAYGGSTLTVYAGSVAVAGFVDSATATSARFSAPEGVAIDSANRKLYVADTGNHAIREIDLSSGAVSTIMGDGTASSSGTVLNQNGLLSTPARLNYPSGITYAYDSDLSSGVLMITERGTHQVRRLILTDSTASNAATITTVSGSYTGTSGFRDDVVGSGALLNTPRGISGITGNVFFVADSGNHAIRKVKLESPVDVTFTMQSVANIEKTVESHDLVIEEYGAYSVNGPPYNETTHFAGVLTYLGEVHELVMCAYPSVEYFVHFEGSMQATVKDSNSYLYIGYTGKTVEDSLSRTFTLRGPGCTDLDAPNYNPYATSDDGSCVSGVKLLFSVSVTGVVDHAVYEFEGPGFYVSDSYESGSGESGFDQADEIEFVAYPGAIYTANFFGALNASLTTVSGQSGLGATSITYWTYTSADANAITSKRARVIGPGCTDPSYVNYDQYATTSDEVNACSLGVTIRVELNASASAASWYDFGSIVSETPALASTLDGISLDNATHEYVAEVTVQPGIYEFKSYGAVSASVEAYDGANLVSLASWTGDTPSLQVDEYGLTSTTLYSRKLTFVPSTYSPRISGGVLSYIGGLMDADDGVSSINFPEGSIAWGTSMNASFTKLVISASTESTWWYTWNVNLNTPYALVLTPNAFRLSKSATLSITYETSQVPSAEGNENLVIVKSKDGTTSSAMALNGATFDASTGKATFTIDSFGGFSVAYRPTIRSVTPPRGSLDGGDTVTIDGVDFSSISTLNTATTYQKCRFGNSFMTATTVTSADVRTTLAGSDSSVTGVKLNAVSCPSPTLLYAGYTAIEFHNVENLMTSENSTFVFLQTATPSILALAPNEGAVSGGAVVHVSGNFLRAGAVASDWEKYDADTTFFHTSGPTVLSCAFGSTASRGVAVSSALAIVEAPPSASQTTTLLRLGDMAYQTSGYGAFSYVGDVVDVFTTANTVDTTGEGGVVVSVDRAIDVSATERLIFDQWRCLFGAISVAARREVDGDYSCVSPAIASGSSVDVRFGGSLGEGSKFLGQHSAPTISSTYVDSIVDVVGTPSAIETLKAIERELSPLFWEPLKWISTAHALVSTPGGYFTGTGQGFGHGTSGMANCTFTTDAGVVTTRVAVIVSSALVICEAPAVSVTTAFALVVSNSIQSSAGSSRTSLSPWFDATTRVHDITTEFVDDWIPSEVSASGGVYVLPSGSVASPTSSTTCYFGVSESTNFSSSLGCLIPRAIAPGFVTLAIGSSTTSALDFTSQILVVPPLRAQKVSPYFVNGDGGAIFEFTGLDLYSPPGSQSPIYCGYKESGTVLPVEYVSSALVKCESIKDSGTYGFRNVVVGRRDDLEGALQLELSASPNTTTLVGLVGTFGVQQYSTPTVTSISPSGASARGGMIVGVTGAEFHIASGAARCAFDSIFVTAAVFNSTYVECVSPASYPMRTYAFTISTSGTAAQRTLDAGYRYANGTSLTFDVF